MDNCANNCDVAKGLRHDVDELKLYTDHMNTDLTEIKQVSAARAVEIKGLTTLLDKLDGTMSTLVDKIDKLSYKIASFNFYTAQEVDTKITEVILLATKDIKQDVEVLKMKPAKKWDAIEMVIITAVIAGVVGFAIGKIFN